MSPASGTAEESALAAVAEVLSCPVCDRGVIWADRVLRCESGHSFDIARQGYVSLLTGSTGKLAGDNAEMLAARAAFQGAGFFEPIAAAVVDAVVCAQPHESPAPVLPGGEVIADIGAGTGYYLAHVLDAVPTGRGIAVDIAKPAGRRCARAHPRAAAVVTDAWRGLPVRDDSLTAALSVFAPRNPAAVARCLAPGGRYIVVTPTVRHLAELIGPIGMVTVDPDKERRLAAGTAGLFTRVDSVAVEYPMALGRADIARLVAMGPSAHHTAATGEQLPEPFEVTASVTVSTYIPLPETSGTGSHNAG